MSNENKQRFDVVAITGEYKNSQGETRYRYVKCGSIWTVVEDGELKWGSMSLDAIPVPRPDNNGEPRYGFKLFPSDKEKKRAPQTGGGSDTGFGSDDVPF